MLGGGRGLEQRGRSKHGKIQVWAFAGAGGYRVRKGLQEEGKCRMCEEVEETMEHVWECEAGLRRRGSWDWQGWKMIGLNPLKQGSTACGGRGGGLKAKNETNSSNAIR